MIFRMVRCSSFYEIIMISLVFGIFVKCEIGRLYDVSIKDKWFGKGVWEYWVSFDRRVFLFKYSDGCLFK